MAHGDGPGSPRSGLLGALSKRKKKVRAKAAVPVARRVSAEVDDAAEFDVPMPVHVVHRAAVVALAPVDVGSVNLVLRGTIVEPGPRHGMTFFFKPHNAQDAPAENAVASTRLARRLGIGDVIAENMFYDFGPEGAGCASVAAPGRKMVRTEYSPDPQPEGYADELGKANGMRKLAGRWHRRVLLEYADIPLTSARTQKGLSDLQLLDALTGQKDRHVNNIFIDPATGKVTGIDDDLSFGIGVPPDDIAGPYDAYPGLPRQVDAATAARVLELTPEKLAAVISPAVADRWELTPQAVQAAQQRLAAVQAYLRGNQVRIVDDWNLDTFQRSLAEAAPGTEPYITTLHSQVAAARANGTINGIPARVVDLPGAAAPGAEAAAAAPGAAAVPAAVQARAPDQAAQAARVARRRNALAQANAWRANIAAGDDPPN